VKDLSAIVSEGSHNRKKLEMRFFASDKKFELCSFAEITQNDSFSGKDSLSISDKSSQILVQCRSG